MVVKLLSSNNSFSEKFSILAMFRLTLLLALKIASQSRLLAVDTYITYAYHLCVMRSHLTVKCCRLHMLCIHPAVNKIP